MIQLLSNCERGEQRVSQILDFLLYISALCKDSQMDF